MRSKRPFVIVTRKLPDPIETRMMELFACRLNLDDKPLGKAELMTALGQADVLVPTVTDRIDGEILAAAGPALKLIASFGTGIDHVDLAAAQQRGIVVTNTPGVLTEDTADMTMALILAVSRRLAEGERLIRSGGWTGWGPTSMLGHRIWGKRLGILGMGRIGMALARRAKGFARRTPLAPRATRGTRSSCPRASPSSSTGARRARGGPDARRGHAERTPRRRHGSPARRRIPPRGGTR